jgi:hypothetical protein
MLDEFCAVVFEGGARDILRESSGAKLKMAQVLFRVGFRLDTGIDIIVAESAQSLLHDKTEYKLNTEGG